ncbi:MAG TPA: hypothetical protein VIJ42_11360 [Stellaceae bacterium]
MPPTKLVSAAIAGAVLLAAPVAIAAGGPATGVYGCYDAQFKFNPVTGRSNLVITPMPVPMFGLIDGSTYSDYDGHRGHYAFDAASGVITMTDGSRQGWRYQRKADGAFELIDNKTGKLWYHCPLEKGKDPTRRPW